jgi:hypothetical protein
VVLPLYEMGADDRCTCGGDCGKNAGKHPRTWHGVADARAEVGKVTAWWRHWPEANIGIATGRVSGLVVLDIDPRNGGNEGLIDLQREHGQLPETAIANTGGGGKHLYFKHPGDREVKNCAALGGFSGLDLKADGGYVVASPSNHQSGGSYLWDMAFHVVDIPLAPCPGFLLKLADVRNDAPRADYDAAGWDGELPPRAGQLLAYSDTVRARFLRNSEGLNDTSTSAVDYSLACQLALCGLSGAEIDHTVRSSRKRAGLGFKHARYIPATVEKALGWAREQAGDKG